MRRLDVIAGGWYRDKTLSGTSFVIALPNYLFLSFAIVAVEHSSRYSEALAPPLLRCW